MNLHNEVNEQATGILKTVSITRLRGVIAHCGSSSNSLNIAYYFNGEPSEEEIEEASVATTYILAALPTIDQLEEKFINIEYPKPLPESEYWVYKRDEG